MNARRVHAVLAAGVRSPDYIDKWRNDPEVLRSHGIEPGSMDLAALWRFAGLTTKVRHNGVRNILPNSFRFMGLAGLEIDLFASYGTYCSANKLESKGTSFDRGSRLIAYIDEWLDREVTDHVLFWDLIRHEFALAQLTKPAPDVPVDSSIAPSELPLQIPDESSIPQVCGKIILHEMQCDPRPLIEILSRREPDWSNIDLATYYFGYWRPQDSAEVQMLDLDEFSYFVLSLVDGSRSSADLGHLLTGNKRPSQNFLGLLGQLSELGLLNFVAVSELEVAGGCK